jgi:hypothetical protein
MRKSALLGYETPRIFTPPLRELTPKTSHGFAAIMFAEQVLGLRLMPWQKWVLIHALELRPDGLYRFRTVILLVARQNGKTLVMLVLALWHIYAKGSKTVIGTAQDLTNAEKAWAEAVVMAQDEEELAELIGKIVEQTGRKALILENRNQYRVAAASRRGARGFSGDLVLLDELREHQTWESWAASTKTTLARPKAQVWCFSNAGDYSSIVLRYLRAVAHQALGWPDGDDDKDILDDTIEEDEDDEEGFDEESLGFFEYSAPPDAPRTDRKGWAQANPSMNHTEVVEDVITERAIAAALKEPKAVFEVEVLCRWLKTLDGGPYPVGAWTSGTDNESKIVEGSPIGACVDVSWDRTMAHIAFCGFRADGDRHVEIVASRAGTEWVKPWLLERKNTIAAVAMQAKGAPVSSLFDELSAVNPDTQEPDLTIVPWEGSELGKAGGQFYDKVARHELDDEGKKVYKPSIWHTKQPILDVAANTAVVKQAGDAWMIDRRRSPLDSSPLIAANGADWVLDQLPESEPESVYENNELMVV